MPKPLPKITDCTDLKGTYVLVRASLNVPIKDGVVINQFRMVRALPTINHLRNAGAKVVVMAHIGREVTDTLQPVCEAMQACLPITWGGKLGSEEQQSVHAGMKDGDVMMIENVRQDEREKANDAAYASELAALGAVYVNDAFAASHRDHASLSAITKCLPSYFGLNFMHEYDELTKAREPKQPSIFILGGAKFDTKMPLVEAFVSEYDHVMIGGALANDIYKARGLEVGTSLVSDVDLSGHPVLAHDNVIVPIDVEVDGPNGRRICNPDEVTAEERILDAGPKTIAEIASLIAAAKTILWNGPLGDYEHGFGTQTTALAKEIADASGYAVIGGGDTIAAMEDLRCQECVGFMSTAGGAMLTFLETGTLPAIDAILSE